MSRDRTPLAGPTTPVEGFLRTLLRAGLPMSSNDVRAAAQSAGGWSWRTVHRAAKRVGVSVAKEAGSLTGAWRWTLAVQDVGSFEADSNLVTVDGGTFEAATVGAGTGDFDQEAFEERAAIMEFDGGLTRDEAEARARSWVLSPDGIRTRRANR